MDIADKLIVQQAIDWLEKNQDKSVEEIQASLNTTSQSGGAEAQDADENAKSLVCGDCGVKLRNEAAAQFHATKSGHINFSQSEEEIAPLTEEEKKQKLADLRAKLSAKRAEGSEQDKIDKKKNEVRSSPWKRAISDMIAGYPPQSNKGGSGHQGRSCEKGANKGGGQEADGEASGCRC